MTVRTSPKPSNRRTLAGLGVLLASALSACGVEAPPGGKPPAIVLSDVTLRHYAADGTVRRGHAAEVTYYRQQGRLEGEHITVDAPPTDDLKRGGVQLAAGQGAADLKGKGARLFGGVTVRTGAGDVGRTEEAVWNGATEIIEGDRPIQVEGPGYRVDADGFAFAVPSQKLELRGDVRIHQEPQPAEEAAK
jgi:LPS export ABC transporter protein LptC